MLSAVFRADASVILGTGHVMRCLALAETLQRRAVMCHFIGREQTGHLLDRVRERGHRVHTLPASDRSAAGKDWQADCEQVVALVRDIRPDWLVVDHYQLGVEWEERVRPIAGRLLAIDDLGRRHCCDLLLDQNVTDAAQARYEASRRDSAELLLGPRFALLRPEFAQLRPQALPRRDGTLRRLLVTMGGSDADNETGKVLDALRNRGGSVWSVDVVIGAGNPNRASVEAACARLPTAQLHVDTPLMGELMLRADCAISAGGSTTWERCCLGLPALVTVLSADQLPIVESLAARGVHVSMGPSTAVTAGDYAHALEELTTERLKAMAAAAAGMCDGLGAGRVADRMQQQVSTCAQ